MLAFALLSKKGGQELRMCQKNHAIKMLPRTGFEPVTYGLLLYSQLQSTALPTELSRVDALGCSSSWLCPAPHHHNLTFTCFNHKAEILVQDESPLPSHCSFLPQCSINQFTLSINTGGVAQMVERSLSMREVPGSIPGASKIIFQGFSKNLMHAP